MSKHLTLRDLVPQLADAPLHTPANDLSTDDFSEAFNRNVLTKGEFETELGRRLGAANERISLPSGALEAATTDDGVSEKDLRDFVKQWFQKIGAGSQVKFSADGLLSPDTKESSLATVFANYTAKLRESRTTHQFLKDLPKDPRGSLVTTRSQQDLALYVPTRGILFMGEVKNASKYDRGSAIRQCAGYLYFQLWWFRTVQGKDVTAVYGFAISGPKCVGVSDKNTKNIAVSLLILKVPQARKVFGQKYELYDHTITRGIADISAFDELGSFLLMKLPDPFETADIHSHFICPGCMLLPDAYLKDGRSEEDRGWRVITTGTGSLVLRCEDKDIVMRLLEDHTEIDAMIWKQRLESDLQESGALFLKCRSLASGREWKSGTSLIPRLRQQMRDLHQFYDDVDADYVRKIGKKWLEMYPADPILTSSCTILVMKNLGTVLSEWPDLAYAEFKSEMLNLIKRTLIVQNLFRVVHGDIHRGNVVFDERADAGWKLQLIDWDEATPNTAAPRQSVTEEQRARYPKSLTDEPDLYTKNQFLCLFSELNTMYEQYDNCSYVQWEGIDYRAKVEELKVSVTNKYDWLIQYLEDAN